MKVLLVVRWHILQMAFRLLQYLALEQRQDTEPVVPQFDEHMLPGTVEDFLCFFLESSKDHEFWDLLN